jgi:hypothetical protein
VGEISKKLARQFRKVNRKLGVLRRQTSGMPQPTGVNDLQDLMRKGHDPIHAPYITVQNLMSVFAENVSQLPEFKPYSKIVAAAEDEYLPDGPPMSPLTRSYFTTWAFFDLVFGKDCETLGNCYLDVLDQLPVNPFVGEIVRNFNGSRMGIYEHCGNDQTEIQLRELVTNELFTCRCPAGYRGKPGELWYVRLCPPFQNLARYWIAFTTPYILTGATKEDWTAYLNKSILGMDAPNKAAALFKFLKFGTGPNTWSEFIFQAYHHHQSDAIFLAGLPDVEGSRPHALGAECR